MQGLVPVIEELAPNVVNRKCAKHIYDNFKQRWGSVDLRKYYWQAATAYTAYGFNKAMLKMKNASVPAHNYLMNIPLGFWARHAFDPTPKIDHCTNNVSESFNSWVEPIRGFSVLNIMEVSLLLDHYALYCLCYL